MAITLKSIETRVEKLALMRAQASELEGELAQVKNAIKEASEELVSAMKEAGTTTIKTEIASVTVSTSQVPQVEDWAEFDAWVLKHKALDMFQRRISVSAWRERTDAGVNVPGVQVFPKDVLTFRTTKEKAKK